MNEWSALYIVWTNERLWHQHGMRAVGVLEPKIRLTQRRVLSRNDQQRRAGFFLSYTHAWLLCCVYGMNTLQILSTRVQIERGKSLLVKWVYPGRCLSHHTREPALRVLTIAGSNCYSVPQNEAVLDRALLYWLPRFPILQICLETGDLCENQLVKVI